MRDRSGFGRTKTTKSAFVVGAGVILRALPDLGVGIVIQSAPSKHPRYKGAEVLLVEWPRDPETGLQSRREVLAREVQVAL